jgi:hypothetical protein
VESIVTTPPAIDGRGAALAGEIARLHERLRPSATPRQPGRDLFSFVAPAPSRPAPVQMPKAVPDEAPIARPAPPALKLSGIAEDATPAGLVRTAILGIWAAVCRKKATASQSGSRGEISPTSSSSRLAEAARSAGLVIELK